MYNNLPQQTPAYYYYTPQFQRGAAPGPESLPQAPAPQTTSFVPQLNYIKGRPVVSIDEARASQIDLDGSLYVFPDLGNKKIYTKQINMDGTATFNVFELAAPAPEAPVPVYVTKTELDEILNQFKEQLLAPKTPQPSAAPKFNL